MLLGVVAVAVFVIAPPAADVGGCREVESERQCLGHVEMALSVRLQPGWNSEKVLLAIPSLTEEVLTRRRRPVDLHPTDQDPFRGRSTWAIPGSFLREP